MSYNEIRTDGFDKNNRPPSSDSPLVIGDDIYAVEYNPDDGGSRLRGKGIFGSTNFTPIFWEDGQWTKVGEKRILEKITSEQKGQWETTIKNSLNNAVELTNGKTPPYLATKIEPSNNGGTGEENNGYIQTFNKFQQPTAYVGTNKDMDGILVLNDRYGELGWSRSAKK